MFLSRLLIDYRRAASAFDCAFSCFLSHIECGSLGQPLNPCLLNFGSYFPAQLHAPDIPKTVPILPDRFFHREEGL